MVDVCHLWKQLVLIYIHPGMDPDVQRSCTEMDCLIEHGQKWTVSRCFMTMDVFEEYCREMDCFAIPLTWK